MVPLRSCNDPSTFTRLVGGFHRDAFPTQVLPIEGIIRRIASACYYMGDAATKWSSINLTRLHDAAFWNLSSPFAL